jgi:hypothetical protein
MPAGTSTTRRPRLRSRGQNTRPGRLRTLAGRSKCVQFAPTASFSSFAYAVSCGSHIVFVNRRIGFYHPSYISAATAHTPCLAHSLLSTQAPLVFSFSHMCKKNHPVGSHTLVLTLSPLRRANRGAARRTGGVLRPPTQKRATVT